MVPLLVLLYLAVLQLPGRPETGRVLFFDDFDGPVLDTSKWERGLHHWGWNNNGVVPENVKPAKIEDEGHEITVLETEAHGDLYKGPITPRLTLKCRPTERRMRQTGPTGPA